MVAKNRDIEELIAVYLSGNASPEQAIELEDWKLESNENLRQFLEYEKLYALLHSENQYDTVDLNKKWKIHLKDIQSPTRVIPLFKNKNFFFAVAALFILAALVYTFWGTNVMDKDSKITFADKKDSLKQIQENQTLFASSGVESFNLKDKSIVELEAKSKLIFDKDFNKSNRKLTLIGSGIFHVQHDENLPFILKVKKLEIHDVGTIFKVQSLSDTVKVIVYEGAVELRLNNQVLQMVEKDSAFYLIDQEIISRYQEPSARQDKIFKFDGTSLSEVARVLSAFFNQKIIIADKEIESCSLSVTFKNENLATILDIIKELLDVEISKNNKTIEIHGKACN